MAFFEGIHIKTSKKSTLADIGIAAGQKSLEKMKIFVNKRCSRSFRDTSKHREELPLSGGSPFLYKDLRMLMILSKPAV